MELKIFKIFKNKDEVHQSDRFFEFPPVANEQIQYCKKVEKIQSRNKDSSLFYVFSDETTNADLDMKHNISPRDLLYKAF